MENNVIKKERLYWIDIAKGFCMLSVIAGHLGVTEVNNIVFSYHLTVFFLLSGYTMHQENPGADYCRKKFLRLMIPYFFTCLCVMLMDIFNSIILTHDSSVMTITGLISKDILRSFFASGSHKIFGAIEVGSRIGAVWFLPALYFALIFTQLILKHFSEVKIQALAAIGIAVAGTVSAPFLWLPFSLQSAAFAVPFIWIGYQARRCDLLSKIQIKHIVVCIVCFAAAVWLNVSKVAFVTASARDLFLSSAVGLMSSTLVIWLAMKIKRCRPLEFIGNNSTYFLCIHLFEMETMGGVVYQDLFQARY